MTLTFSSKAWDNYLYWQKTDKATLKRINYLIKEIQRTPVEGIGKPEALKKESGLRNCINGKKTLA